MQPSRDRNRMNAVGSIVAASCEHFIDETGNLNVVRRHVQRATDEDFLIAKLAGDLVVAEYRAVYVEERSQTDIAFPLR